MTTTTFERLLARLNAQIMHHPHKSEITALMQKQLEDDTLVLVQETHDCP